ncbi:MAG: 30S ribosomal protein S9 [Acidobacteria bacterium]|nr:30S ribosomal protein S9 [Acidobacteriota bacterium]
MGEAEVESTTVEHEPETAPAPAVAPEPAPTRLYGTGRRKTSVARVFLRPGTGQVKINDRPADKYFPNPFWRKHAREPLDFVGASEQYDAMITVRGGGMTGQAGAVRLGLARALAAVGTDVRVKLRQGGFLTRNPRMKERKKYGQKGARKRFQWTKR